MRHFFAFFGSPGVPAGPANVKSRPVGFAVTERPCGSFLGPDIRNKAVNYTSRHGVSSAPTATGEVGAGRGPGDRCRGW
jgi:hypothetical protein